MESVLYFPITNIESLIKITSGNFCKSDSINLVKLMIGLPSPQLSKILHHVPKLISRRMHDLEAPTLNLDQRSIFLFSEELCNIWNAVLSIYKTNTPRKLCL